MKPDEKLARMVREVLSDLQLFCEVLEQDHRLELNDGSVIDAEKLSVDELRCEFYTSSGKHMQDFLDLSKRVDELRKEKGW